MALEAIQFQTLFTSLYLLIFFLSSFTVKNEKSAVGFSMWKIKSAPIFCNSDASHCHSMKHVRLGFCRILDGTHYKCYKSRKICNTTNI